MRSSGDIGSQIFEFDEVVCLTPEFIGNKGGLRPDAGYDKNPHTLAVNSVHTAPEIAIAGCEHDVVHVRRKFQHIDNKFDVHISLDSPPSCLIGILFGRFCYHGEAVAIEPVHQGPQRRIFLVFHQRCVIKRTIKTSLGREQRQQTLVVDIEIKGLGWV